MGFQGVWSGAVGPQQDDDVFSGLVETNTHTNVGSLPQGGATD